MDRLSRRDLLAAASALAAGILLPFPVKSASLSPEELEARAAALSRSMNSLHARSMDSLTAVLGTGRAHFQTISDVLARTRYDRRPLHRAASATARVCALASRWSGIDGQQWVTIAETEAKTANDGPLLAHAWLERAWSEQGFTECPSRARLSLVTAALDRAGLADEQSSIRASIRQERAWELAMAGNRRGALLELDSAAFEADKAGWTASAIRETIGTGLRVMGRPAEAERSLWGALDQPPVRRVLVLCEIAQAHLDLDEVDGAAQDLEEAFLLTRAHGIKGRLQYILAAKTLLPPGRAARELDEVMRGA